MVKMKSINYKRNDKYFELLYDLIIKARSISYEIKKTGSLNKIESLIELLEIAHNIPVYLKESRFAELEEWIEINMK